MTEQELNEKLEMIQKMKSETSTLELKSAEKGCPQHLYDSLSSFSNQDEGGIIIFGIDEKQDYKVLLSEFSAFLEELLKKDPDTIKMYERYGYSGFSPKEILKYRESNNVEELYKIAFRLKKSKD